MKEILFAGIGGQGIILSANILAQSAFTKGYHAAQSQSYGSESRGTISRAGVIISDEFIDFPHVEHADYFVAMAEPAFNLLKGKVKKDAVVIYDGSVFTPAEQVGKEMINVEATKLSLEQLGKPLFANIIILGTLIKKSGLLPIEDVTAELKQVVPPKAIEQNVNALKLGYDAV